MIEKMPRRLVPVTRSGWWAGLAAVLLPAVIAVTGFVALTHRSHRPVGGPLPWQAFYDPAERYLLVWPTRGLCGTETKVSETADSIKVSVRESPVPPGHGSCVSPVGNEHFVLRSPVGARSIVSADAAGSGMAFRLTERLHARFSGDVSSLPFISMADRDTRGRLWTLSYYQPNSSEAFTLTSTVIADAAGRAGDVTVRGSRNVLPCAGVLCWNEAGYTYSVSTGPIGGVRPLTVGQAVAFADSLVR